MPVQTYTMGPGTLTLTVDADDLSVETQVRSFKVECSENVKSTDPVPVLSGDELVTPDVVTLTWKVSGKLVQDLAAAGCVAFTWDNAGAIADFVFVPSTSADRQVSGVCRLVPLSVGGDVRTNPDSDFSWTAGGTADSDGAITGNPVLAAAA